MPRRIVITGASRGIGRAAALRLAEAEGADLLLLGRDREALEATALEVRAAGGGATTATGDVCDRTWMAALGAAETSVDGLVAAAGISGLTPVDRDEDDRFDRILATNLGGTWNTVRAFLPRMGRGGRVVLVASVLGRFGVPGYSAYCAAKAGVLGLGRALALEVADRGILVNTLVPGWVDTDMATAGLRDLAAALGVTEAEARRRAERAVPLKRFGRPEETAEGVLWLLSPANTLMLGKSLVLDGGSVQE